VELSGYRFMWVVAMFDLPVDTKQARREYAKFRKNLIRQGFTRMQYSVYIRHSTSRENAAAHAERVRGCLPPDGEVRVLQITDKQFERMAIFFGKRRAAPERGPTQLQFF
jgi:CRISPR-associated protein Cas2